ncbi:MAG: DUF1722 domain-containing protein [Clostridiaceae bacterium]
MSIGYESFALGVKGTDFIDLNQESSNREKQIEIMTLNLKSLEKLLDYNIANQIGFFSIDSKLIPFGAKNQSDFLWEEIFRSEFTKLGEKINQAKIRISMKPDKLNLLNSINEEVASEAMKDLEVHAKFLQALNLGREHKMVINVGGIVGGKKEALERLKYRFHGLDKSIQMRIALINDETDYNLMDVLDLGKVLHLPVVFHNRNHALNPSVVDKDEKSWIKDCKASWKENDGDQILYYTEINSGKPSDFLAETIGIKKFLDFYQKLDPGVDLMLESRDRNLSAVKCINCILDHGEIKVLEVEWQKYKYTVLENSHQAYLQIRSLLKEKDKYPAILFYTLIEEALKGKKREGFVNAAQHVWGYFKKCASDKEKNDFLRIMEEYKVGKTTMNEIKKSLWKLAMKYEVKYLVESYYFIL